MRLVCWTRGNVAEVVADVSEAPQAGPHRSLWRLGCYFEMGALEGSEWRSATVIGLRFRKVAVTACAGGAERCGPRRPR